MSIEEFKKQFQQIIRRRNFDSDGFIDVQEERDVLRDCLEIGIPEESAQAVLHELCQSRSWVLESAVRKIVALSLRKSLGDDGKIDEEEFNEAVSIAAQASNGRCDDAACKRIVIDMMDKGEAPVKTGLFGGWYKRVKKEVGLA